MFVHVLDNVLKATETTVSFQQELWRNIARPWWVEPAAATPTPSPEPGPVAGPTETITEEAWPVQFEAFHKKWTRSMDDLLSRHHATLDAQYEEGLKAIRGAFRAGRSRTPAELRRGVESVWKEGIASIKGLTEQQLDEFRAASEAWFEAVARVMPPVND